jgi:A/G-specific adenine glycosylase
MIRAAGPSTRSDSVDIAARLLAWYDRERRDLAWRARPGERADPYHVWLSEMMLQQTTVKAVTPYFQQFVKRWPDVRALAQAPLDDVLAAWAGLGYYARARNLHKTAKIIAEEHAGVFPDSLSRLVALPGIGPYTGAAIAAIAFDRPETVVDGNVERVVARLFGVRDPLPGARPRLRELARELTPHYRPGDFAQAMMDLGAGLCASRSPSCTRCPLLDDCAAAAQGIAAQLPMRTPKPERPTRRGAAFVAHRGDDHVLLRRRPENGLLGAMMEPPTSAWTARGIARQQALADVPVPGNWRALSGRVSHTFSHFQLELDVYLGQIALSTPVPDDGASGWRWVARARLGEQALPSLMRKVLAHALKS